MALKERFDKGIVLAIRLNNFGALRNLRTSHHAPSISVDFRLWASAEVIEGCRTRDFPEFTPSLLRAIRRLHDNGIRQLGGNGRSIAPRNMSASVCRSS